MTHTISKCSHTPGWFDSSWRLAYSPTLQQKLQSSTRPVTDLNQNQTILGKLYDDILELQTSLQNPLMCAEITQNDPASFCLDTKLNLDANQHLTFILHEIFQGLPFHVIWDVADKHPVSLVHVSVGFKAPASASFLGSLLPAGVGLMFGFPIHFSVGRRTVEMKQNKNLQPILPSQTQTKANLSNGGRCSNSHAPTSGLCCTSIGEIL